MITYLLLALVSIYGVKSGAGSGAEWVQGSYDSLWSDSRNGAITYPDGHYLADGPKEILWKTSDKPIEKMAVIDPKALKKTPKNSPQVVEVKAPVPAKETPKTEINQEGIDDLGLVTDKKENLSVSANEILSYFDKKGERKNSHEELGAFVSPNQPSPPHKAGDRVQPELK